MRAWAALLIAALLIVPCALGGPVWAEFWHSHAHAAEHHMDHSAHSGPAGTAPHHSEHDSALCRMACQKWLVTRAGDHFVKTIVPGAAPQPGADFVASSAASYPLVILTARMRSPPYSHMESGFAKVFAQTGRLHL